ncbi:M14 family metallopeptidase [Fulvivirga sediminis]|uniref:Zinc carboxypeptidase n=1 Tax=Fulvivirga sediminis TaxID=2803949 RepID=A0A937FBR6_9BACT|nr:M14 family metallopeptidase [Fulvivirga sediminis]MBL3657874.1 zinc carboxypeptidase [Fulvivirga sediminis]
MKNTLIVCLLIVSIMTHGQSIQSPDEFLGYTFGERFTRHHQVVDYYEYLNETLPNVNLKIYGETYEHRPLTIAIISSPENMDKLEEIRQNNLNRISGSNRSQDDITIVWLSYNIHGNEASSTEASMKTIYTLLTDEKAQSWLKNTVVIIDPCVNPDGRDRYVNFYNQYANTHFNPSGDAIEHHEPWPGGRPNHYLFDLNRDWAWQTQIESQQRSKIYHQWMPHVHVDYHEQFINSPYYFAPAAEPFHEIITPWQREFQTMIGKNHAKYFDAQGWLYFTRELFDLLYPSYGDTYPTYNGAIGMTYEQAGHGYAGLGIITEYGDTLTLKDRIEHHFTTGLSTVEISSENASKLVAEFGNYFKNNRTNPSAKYKSYVIHTENMDKLKALTLFLENHHIEYGTVAKSGNYKGYSYTKNSESSFNISDKDLIISSFQSQSRLLTALFEPNTKLSDTLTYDITAWSIPFAYGVEAYALTEKLPISSGYNFKEAPMTQSKSEEKAYAYVLAYQSIEDVKFLSAALQQEINVRVSHKTLKIQGHSFAPGAVVITRRNNENISGNFEDIVTSLADEYGRELIKLTTGFSENGVDLGSGQISRLKAPKVAVITGEHTSSLNFGEVWHFFEQQIHYPVTNIGTQYFSYTDLSDYDVIIMPSGNYGFLNDKAMEELKTWIKSGGKLIAMGSALNSFNEKKDFGLKQFNSDQEKKAMEAEPTTEEQLKPYDLRERQRLSDEIFGAIYKVSMDNTNPLAYGYDPTYYSLKTSNDKYAYLKDGSNVGILKDAAAPVSGFAGYKAAEKLENSLVFGIQSIGRGNIIYMVDDPLFRSFWENGKLLFSNAVFVVD